ncbi:hypothetical protein [Hoeflea sp.]|uniref:hypothetical protein n=1 Tax=Hoeflea sp. TaxID=1940281 RepID=UPI003BB15574
METWLKILITAACGVVLVVGLALGWGLFSDYLQERSEAEKRERIRADLFLRAEAEPNEVEKVIRMCEDIAYYIDRSDQDYVDAMTGIHLNCRMLGYR